MRAEREQNRTGQGKMMILHKQPDRSASGGCGITTPATGHLQRSRMQDERMGDSLGMGVGPSMMDRCR